MRRVASSPSRTTARVVVSTSRHFADVSGCHRLGAADYLQKSIDLDALAGAIGQVADYWLKTVVPPVPNGG
ncbi:MAG: hypothetical protein ABSC06_23095 [Rhodopila sp.]